MRCCKCSPRECQGGRQTSGDKEEELVQQAGKRVIPGSKTTMRTLSENPDALEVSGIWGVTVMRSFFYKVARARDIVDIQIAAGAALQDLDELQGIAQYGEALQEQA